MSGPGARLLEWVATADAGALPKTAWETARLAALDWWGVTVAGADEPVARLVREALPEPPGPASVLGTERTASPVTAALWNGIAAHALDYDDTVLALPGHVTAPLLPGLLALGEARRLDGRRVLAAFVLGVEVMCRIARALRPGHYRAGWHATATLGRLGGAAAGARLLGLSVAGVDRAVGLAAAQAAGIQESFGTMAKPFQVGRAAADGLASALLAERGVTAAAAVLDRPGFSRRLSPDWMPARLAEDLGERWAIGDVFFKRYPCCFATHAAVTALLDVASRAPAGAIEAVDLEVGPTTLQVADQREPRTGLAGKFSMTYCAASALLRGHVREDDFAEASVRDPAAHALAARVRLHPRPELDEAQARAAVRLRDGALLEVAVDLRDLTDPERLRRELVAKFLDLTGPRLGHGHARRLGERLLRIDEVEDLRTLGRGSGG